MKKKQIIKYFVSVYLLSLTIMTLIRLGLFLLIKEFPLSKEEISLLPQMFLKGISFDSLITCYLLVLPILITLIYSLFSKKNSPIIWAWINGIITILFSLVFALFFINIPYFDYNQAHFTISEFEYLKYLKTTIGLVTSEVLYWACFILYIITLISFHLILKKISKLNVLKKNNNLSENKYSISLTILIIGLFCGIGMRGTLARYPLKPSNAAYCNNSLFNKLAINSVFYFIKTAEKQSKGFNSISKITDIKTSYKTVKKELGVTSSKNTIDRLITFKKQTVNKPNIVFILCESLSMKYLDMKKEDGTTLMPFIKELTKKSYFFDHFYSAGIHTNNGILASLYGFPTIFNRASLQNKKSFYTGIPYYLKEQNYTNHFFITGNPHYDNMNGFLYENGSFDKIYSLNDYPKEKRVNNFGIQDDYLFEFGIKKLNTIAKKKQPFLATFLTISNHPPFIVPKKYQNNNFSEEIQIMPFVDDTLRKFFKEAEKQEWSDNTIFILLGDHGKALGNEPYPMPISYNHIPLIIYSKTIKKNPKTYSQLGGQIDLFPTLLSLLKISHINNGLGIDLFKDKREQMFFVNNTQLGCINKEYFYTYNLENKLEGLYEYKTLNTKNLIKDSLDITKQLKIYGTSMIRVAEEEIINKK